MLLSASCAKVGQLRRRAFDEMLPSQTNCICTSALYDRGLGFLIRLEHRRFEGTHDSYMSVSPRERGTYRKQYPEASAYIVGKRCHRTCTSSSRMSTNDGCHQLCTALIQAR